MAGPLLQEPAAVAKIERHVNAILTLFLCAKLDHLPYTGEMMWVMLIAGSCLAQEELQTLLAGLLRNSKYSTWNSTCAARLLEMLWKDKDARAFGPHGLHLTMQKQGVIYCLA